MTAAAQFTEQQIEEAALALHQRRNENYLRRCPKGRPTAYEGEERGFCLASAKNDLEQTADRERMAQAIIDGFAHWSNADLEGRIKLLTDRQAEPMHFIAISSTAADAEDHDLFRLRSELSRRQRADADLSVLRDLGAANQIVGHVCQTIDEHPLVAAVAAALGIASAPAHELMGAE